MRLSLSTGIFCIPASGKISLRTELVIVAAKGSGRVVSRTRMVSMAEMRQRQRRAIKKFADPFRSLNLRRKRLAAVIAGLKSRTRRYKKHRRYNRASWDWWMRFIDPDTNDTEFRKFYRLPKAVFDAVSQHCPGSHKKVGTRTSD